MDYRDEEENIMNERDDEIRNKYEKVYEVNCRDEIYDEIINIKG